MSSNVAANVLGTIGTLCWCVQLVPQIWYNWRRKSTEGLPASMMFLWAMSGVPFGVYAIIQELNIPLQCQPQIFMSLSLVTWGQILYYTSKYPYWKAIGYPIVLAVICAAIQAGCIIGLKGPYDDGTTYPLTIVGIIAAVLLAGGLIPPYFEIRKRRGRVVGINWVFLSVDFAGALFSLLSLLVESKFDVLAGVMYSVCMALELGIFGCHIIWLIRKRMGLIGVDDCESGSGNGEGVAVVGGFKEGHTQGYTP